MLLFLFDCVLCAHEFLLPELNKMNKNVN